MRRWRLPSAFAFLAFIAPLSAAAQNWGEPGGWSVGQTDDRCLATMEFEGPGSTEMSFSLELDGGSYVIVTNYNWTVTENQEYELDYRLSHTSYSGTAVGTKSSIRSGFVTKFGAGFLDDLAKTANFHIYRGDVPVDRLSMSGSAAAISVLRRCIEAVRRTKEAEERERRRWEDIPRNPFGD